MSDEIKVGDRVRPNWSSTLRGTVLACGFDKTCVKWDEHDEPAIWNTSSLALIPPEPVALTPKYPVGSTVKAKAGKCAYKVTSVFVVYYLDNQEVEWREDELEPVPDLCPTCKGSGKASE
jgi:hypothetical protein